MSRVVVLFVDLQNDFTQEWGKEFKPRPCVKFIRKNVFGFLEKKGVEVVEVISDYRQPRPGDRGDCCCPGSPGFKSELLYSGLRCAAAPWIKCMHSPIWTRENIGDAKKEPGPPYQDPQAFGKWLNTAIGHPKTVDVVVLMGLTLDCCVLCAAQELRWRGYEVRILSEATDTYSGNPLEKDRILICPPITNWAKPIPWARFKIMF